MVTFHAFEDYLFSAPFKTRQMVNKQTIKLNDLEEDEIIRTRTSCCAYIDEEYFEKVMGEVQDNSAVTYSVRFRAIRADFIINGKEGYKFLEEVLRQNRMALFETPYMKVLT